MMDNEVRLAGKRGLFSRRALEQAFAPRVEYFPSLTARGRRIAVSKLALLMAGKENLAPHSHSPHLSGTEGRRCKPTAVFNVCGD